MRLLPLAWVPALLCAATATTAATEVPASVGATTAPAAVAEPAPARRPRPKWQLVVHAPSPLDALLMRHLDLARYQQEGAADGDEASRIGRGELRRLVAAVPEQARGLLDAEGHFAAQVSVRMTGQDADGDGTEDITVQIDVQPGPQTQVQRVEFAFEGDLDRRLSEGDAAAQGMVDALRQHWALGAGLPFRQTDWTAARNAALARLRADTYPTASWSGTSVSVDAQQARASLFLVADSGPAYAMGPIRVEGLVRQPASAIVNLAPFDEGSPYRERQVLDWQERIQKLNLFENVFVSPVLDASQPHSTPLVVQVRELPLQAATFGVGVSSDNGPRLTAEHLHRNPFSVGWQAKTRVQLGARLSDAQLDWLSHPWPARKRGVVSAQFSSEEDNDNAITTSERLKVGRIREGERLERLQHVEWLRAVVRSAQGLRVSAASAYSASLQWIFRDVDSQILPTRGSTSMLQLTAGRAHASLGSDGVFSRVHARVTAYQPLPWSWQLVARAEGGQLVARDEVSVPDTLLFRVGGDDSVRGYAHRSIGVERDGVTVGGRAMATASVELAHPLWPGLPSLQGAVFVDVGDAADSFARWSSKRGEGVGVRWRSPVGPFRVDVARASGTGQWRLHFSVGISL